MLADGRVWCVVFLSLFVASEAALDVDELIFTCKFVAELFIGESLRGAANKLFLESQPFE